ncbi:cytochrome P450 [Colletotrichum plurivorum]|uniref:Cytochrome P450 n=1 Tax=Colletotrichum plurivorum TaxID=2175906 RepID=A0A8H6JSW4_9PEZI|nr:cytochrome P450 [Colletotrichum plurivorum]
MILYLLFLFAGWYALSSFASWYRLRHFKGPFLASFTHLWLSYGAITGRSWETYQDVCETYGSLARLGPDTLVTDDPDLIRRMSAARSPTLDKALHDQLKARTTPAYSGRDVPDLEGAVDSVVRHLQRFIREGIAKSVVADRFRLDAEKKNDMLGSFLRHGIDAEQCESEVLLLIIAGSDNTSGTIRATLLYLMTNPRAYQRLQREIDEAAASGQISAPITNEEAKSLPYLQAVIQEGLRIFSPSGSLLTKQAPPEGHEFKGHRIPGGVNIGQSTWAMMRRKDIFGEDADVFRPERFLEADPKRRDEMEKVVDLNFGYGRWGCSGKPVALMELNKVFLLRYFDFQLCDPSNPWAVKTYPVLVTRNMNVIVTERKLV